jgi:ubiquinone/menaquinone biosynthesis C-methylase UbiE
MDRARFIPALRFAWLTRAYDPIVRVTTRERRFKALLVDQLGVRPGHRVLDIGCGTATLTIAIKRACPAAEVVGIDVDPEIVALARRKIERSEARVEVRTGSATQLPFGDASFDRVASSLVFHHLDRDAKRAALREAARVLVAGGELHIADWGRPHGPVMRAAFLGVQVLDGFVTTGDSVRGSLPELIAEAGFREVAETHRLRTPLGTIALYRGRR